MLRARPGLPPSCIYRRFLPFRSRRSPDHRITRSMEYPSPPPSEDYSLDEGTPRPVKRSKNSLFCFVVLCLLGFVRRFFQSRKRCYDRGFSVCPAAHAYSHPCIEVTRHKFWESLRCWHNRTPIVFVAITL